MVFWAIVLLCTSASTLSKTNKVLYAIDCGGEGFKSRDGVVYKADDHYVGGVASDFGKSVATFRFTDIPEVYQTERYDTEDFSYLLPLPKDGKYVLVLKFSEVWFDQEGEKIFSVKLGSRVVVDSIDIFGVIGKNSAYDEFIEFELKEGKVLLAGREAGGAYIDGHLKVDFVKTSRDNPKINGIMIVKGTRDDTHYAEQMTVLAAIAKQKAVLDKDVFIESGIDEESDFEDDAQELRRRAKPQDSNSGFLITVLMVVVAGGLWLLKLILKPKVHNP